MVNENQNNQVIIMTSKKNKLVVFKMYYKKRQINKTKKSTSLRSIYIKNNINTNPKILSSYTFLCG